MTVLYGLNGAGKSYVLDAVRCCLTGRLTDRLHASSMSILAEVPSDFERYPIGLSNAFAAVTGDDLGSYGLFGRLTERIEAYWSRSWESGYHEEFTQRSELAREFAESRLVLVRPIGIELPSWEIRPAVIPSPATPATNALLRRLESLDALDDEDALTFAPVYRLWRAAEDKPATAPTVLYSEAYSFSVSEALGKPVGLWGDIIAETAGDPDVDSGTRAAFQALIDGYAFAGLTNQLERDLGLEASHVVPEWSLDALVDEVQTKANRLYPRFLSDAPALELALEPVERWLGHPPLRWMARRMPSDEPIPVAWLSRAEQRWAKLSIALALCRSQQPLVLLDEPEAALHRTAEAHMASALTDAAESGQARFLVSTHSPELLDSRGVRRVLVRRRSSEQAGALLPFSGADLHALTDLGLQPSDLLRRTRAFMLVEGEHDLVAFQGWFATSLTELGVELLPMRGASRLKNVLDSRFLFDYTDAVLCPFLDDVKLEKITAAWDAAVQLNKTASATAAIEYLQGNLRALTKGIDFLLPFLTRALQLGRASRICPLGVSALDILDYFPVDQVVPGAHSWRELRAELQREKHGERPTETEFKSWLTTRHHADLSPEALSRVAEASTPPQELVEVVDQLQAVLRGDDRAR